MFDEKNVLQDVVDIVWEFFKKPCFCGWTLHEILQELLEIPDNWRESFWLKAQDLARGRWNEAVRRHRRSQMITGLTSHGSVRRNDELQETNGRNRPREQRPKQVTTKTTESGHDSSGALPWSRRHFCYGTDGNWTINSWSMIKRNPRWQRVTLLAYVFCMMTI